MSYEVLENGDILIQPSPRLSTRGRLARQRVRLFNEQKGKCYWCLRQMKLLKLPPNAKKFPPELATIEHLRDRFDPTRRDKCESGEKRHVLACLECNNKRGAQRSAEFIDEQRIRSGHGPGRPTRKVLRRIGHLAELTKNHDARMAIYRICATNRKGISR